MQASGRKVRMRVRAATRCKLRIRDDARRSPRAGRRVSWAEAIAIVALSTVAACAPTSVRPRAAAPTDAKLSRPERIAVLSFTVDPDDVSEDQAVGARIARSFSSSSKSDRQLEIAKKLSDRLADDVVSGIQKLGLSAERADRATPLSPGTLVIDGRFTKIDQGNRTRRIMIGLGAGQSTVDAAVEVDVLTANGRSTVLAFDTEARSAPMPGAAVTMGAGAAAQGGATVASAAASGGAGALKESRSSVESDTGRTAKQIVAYLSEFFAKQGWISADLAQEANVHESSPATRHVGQAL
jgi:Domain of unknown function (DUF4410)